MNKLKTQNLESLKDILDRDIRIGSDGDNLSEATIKIYLRQLVRLFNAGLKPMKFVDATGNIVIKEYNWSPNEFIARVQRPNKYDDVAFQKTFKVKKSDMIELLFTVYTSKESLILTLNAMCKMTKNRYKSTFDYYNKIRKELSKQNKAEKLDNELTPEEAERYISYQELMKVPEKAKKSVIDNFGKLYLSNAEISELKRGKRSDYLRSVFDYITLYLNVHYPLRLVWASVQLTSEEGKNYLEGNKLHLNDFKNIRLMGAQVIELDKPTMALIDSYLNFLKTSLNEQPVKLLYRLYNGNPSPYDYSGSSNGFSQVISKLFVKYNEKPISMNIIRHIVESHIIQSPSYAKLTNREKNDLHAKLLHSAQAANISYNKIANRATAPPEPEFEYEAPASTPPKSVSPPKVAEKAKPRRERIFHGDFTPSGSDHTLEIEIFEK